CLALVSPRWSFLAPRGCDTLTGITRRRQEDSFEPGLGTSAGGIKPCLSGSSGWSGSTKQTKQTKQTK
ncbi:MAG: hypothetical protein ND866_27935, partial [Pyrinomonadaceae bacterium]|nr:hypothetical protein [Pyrinomonadaceae bacterium]